MENENNIFKFATNELSQDAFICWLINWLNIETANDEIKKVAENFLLTIATDADRKELIKIIKSKKRKIEIKKQYNKIDVLILIYSKNDRSDQYAIVIEDKVDSNEHDCQIEKYKLQIQNDVKLRTKKEKIITCYYKSYDEANITKKNVDSIFTRERIIELLKKYTKDDIEYLSDYKKYLMQIEKCIEVNEIKEGFFSEEKIKNIKHCAFFKSLENINQWKGIYWGHTTVANGCTWWCNMGLNLKINTLDNKFNEYAFLKLNLEKNEGIGLRICKVEEDKEKYETIESYMVVQNGKINKHEYSYDPMKYNSYEVFDFISEKIVKCIERVNKENNCKLKLSAGKVPSSGRQREITIFHIGISSLKKEGLYDYTKITKILNELKLVLENEVKSIEIKLNRDKNKIEVIN